jgi:hypothetical protein
MSTEEYLVALAETLIGGNPDYLKDARQGASAHNTLVGAIMAHATGSPRWLTERAVQLALSDREDL